MKQLNIKNLISLLCFPVFLLSIISSSSIASTTYDGVVFPEGDLSFADAVVSYVPGSDVGNGWLDPTDALGAPDYDGSGNGDVSLGDDGVLILQFIDNSLTTSGDSAKDLWVFEVGPAVEAMNVMISTDNSNWIDLGSISGSTYGIDIDSIQGVVLGELYSYIMLTDIAPNQSGAPYGEADIDAVGAISSGSPAVVPLPAAVWLFGFGLIGLLGVAEQKKA